MNLITANNTAYICKGISHLEGTILYVHAKTSHQMFKESDLQDTKKASLTLTKTIMIWGWTYQELPLTRTMR